jgi:hypothetical protein
VVVVVVSKWSPFGEGREGIAQCGWAVGCPTLTCVVGQNRPGACRLRGKDKVMRGRERERERGRERESKRKGVGGGLETRLKADFKQKKRSRKGWVMIPG